MKELLEELKAMGIGAAMVGRETGISKARLYHCTNDRYSRFDNEEVAKVAKFLRLQKLVRKAGNL